MGKPSEQIRCEDWTAGYVLDDAVLTYGGWVTEQVRRYSQHTPDDASGKPGKPPTLENVIEYERALIEGTPFQRIIPKRRLRGRKRQESPPVEEGR